MWQQEQWHHASESVDSNVADAVGSKKFCVLKDLTGIKTMFATTNNAGLFGEAGGVFLNLVNASRVEVEHFASLVRTIRKERTQMIGGVMRGFLIITVIHKRDIVDTMGLLCGTEMLISTQIEVRGWGSSRF